MFYDNFQGSAQNPAVEEDELNIALDEHGGTYWASRLVCWGYIVLW
jgi:hypothetical protein